MLSTKKRFRPRFSIRTLAIAVTLMCCYAACWGPTKTRGIVEVAPSGIPGCTISRSVVAPLVVALDEMDANRSYYFWFFGYVAKLPYERAWTYAELIEDEMSWFERVAD